MNREPFKKELIEKAKQMRKKAYCPYSSYRVGAAVLTSSGRIYTGCNVENASYSVTICAERTAGCKAVSEGEREFEAVAIAVSGGSFGYPCGACRQFLNEFAVADMEVIVINNKDEVNTVKLNDILPYGFKGGDML